MNQSLTQEVSSKYRYQSLLEYTKTDLGHALEANFKYQECILAQNLKLDAIIMGQKTGQHITCFKINMMRAYPHKQYNDFKM